MKHGKMVCTLQIPMGRWRSQQGPGFWSNNTKKTLELHFRLSQDTVTGFGFVWHRLVLDVDTKNVILVTSHFFLVLTWTGLRILECTSGRQVKVAELWYTFTQLVSDFGAAEVMKVQDLGVETCTASSRCGEFLWIFANFSCFITAWWFQITVSVFHDFPLTMIPNWANSVRELRHQSPKVERKKRSCRYWDFGRVKKQHILVRSYHMEVCKMAVPQWFIMEHPIKKDDLGVPLFYETCILRAVPFQFGCSTHPKLIFRPFLRRLQRNSQFDTAKSSLWRAREHGKGTRENNRPEN